MNPSSPPKYLNFGSGKCEQHGNFSLMSTAVFDTRRHKSLLQRLARLSMFAHAHERDALVQNGVGEILRTNHMSKVACAYV